MRSVAELAAAAGHDTHGVVGRNGLIHAAPKRSLAGMTDVTTATLPLARGGAIPIVGLGVWQTPAGSVTRAAVTAALEAGYRHVDTARIYGNEADVGGAIRASGVARSDVFVTTKLWNDDQGYEQALAAIDASLAALGLDYVDLYLVHWPVAGRRLESWRALERIKREGRARAIGVSNFLVPHLEELLARCNEPPAVNQIEVHPFLQHRETRAYCAARNIVVEAYSPLANGRRLGDPAVGAIARRVGRSPAQVLLRWGIQHGMVVLPKSVHAERIRQNAQVFDFELDATAMTALDGLDAGAATCWDPREQT